jgi:hypothetical protein
VARKLRGEKKKWILFSTWRIGNLQNLTRFSSIETGNHVFMREHLQFFQSSDSIWEPPWFLFLMSPNLMDFHTLWVRIHVYGNIFCFSMIAHIQTSDSISKPNMNPRLIWRLICFNLSSPLFPLERRSYTRTIFTNTTWSFPWVRGKDVKECLPFTYSIFP